MKEDLERFRVCENCFNEINLNLFKPDKKICRYCESGSKIPNYIINITSSKGINSSDNEVNINLESEKEANDL